MTFTKIATAGAMALALCGCAEHDGAGHVIHDSDLLVCMDQGRSIYHNLDGSWYAGAGGLFSASNYPPIKQEDALRMCGIQAATKVRAQQEQGR